MRYIFILIVSLISTHSIDAASLSWVKQIGGSADCSVIESCVDNYGNIYIVGQFQNGSISLNTVDSIYSTNSVYDYFIAKYSESGNLTWFKHIKNSTVYSIEICTDGTSKLFLTGAFTNTFSIDSNSITSQGVQYSADIFVFSLNTDSGNLNWLKRVGGYSDDYGEDICVDSEGNIGLIGTMAFTVQFDTISVTAVSEWDIFVAKIDPQGNFLWVKLLYGPGNNIGDIIEYDNNNHFIISGHFGWACTSATTGPMQIDSIVLTGYSNYSTIYNRDAFIAKISSIDGHAVWAKSVKGPGSNSVGSIDVEENGRINLTGSFDDVSGGYFQNDLIIAGVYQPAIAQNNIYWAQLNTDGFLEKLNVGYNDNGLGAKILPIIGNNYILFTLFLGESYLDTVLISDTINGLVWAYLDSNHTFISYSQINASFISANYFNSSDLYMSCNFSGTTNIGNILLQSVSKQDVFIAKYSNVTPVKDVFYNPISIIAWYNQNNHTICLKSENETELVNIELFDITGKKVFKEEQKGYNDFQFDIPKISSGVYIIKAILNSKYKYSRKIIIH